MIDDADVLLMCLLAFIVCMVTWMAAGTLAGAAW